MLPLFIVLVRTHIISTSHLHTTQVIQWDLDDIFSNKVNLIRVYDKKWLVCRMESEKSSAYLQVQLFLY